MSNQVIRHQKTSLVRKLPEKYLQTLCKKMSEELGVRVQSVEAVAKGYENQIRNKDGMNVRAELILLLPQLAKIYGGSKEIDRKVLAEAIRLILKKSISIAQNCFRE